MITILYDGNDSDKVFSKLIKKLAKNELAIIPMPSYDFETKYGLHISPTLNHLVEMLGTRISRLLNSYKIQYAFRGFDFARTNLNDLELILSFLMTICISRGIPLTELYERLTKSLDIRYKLMPLYDPPPHIIIKSEDGSMICPLDLTDEFDVDKIKEISYGNLDKAKIIMETKTVLEESKVILFYQISPITLFFLKSIGTLKKTLENFRGTIIYFLPQNLSVINNAILKKLGYDEGLQGLVKMAHEHIDAIILDDQNQQLISDLSEVKLTLYPTHYAFKTKDGINKFVNDLLKILK